MKKILYILFSLILFSSCAKEYLEEKSDQKLLVPSTLTDLQLLLNNFSVMESQPGLGTIASDDFYTTDKGYFNGRLTEIEKLAYIMDLPSIEILGKSEWNLPYEQIFYCNVVLDEFDRLNDGSKNAKEIKGSALFYRSHAFFKLLQIFAPPYEEATASTVSSIPFPLSSDINAKRAIFTMKEAYNKIIADLQEASGLLPDHQIYKSRPSKLAVLSLLGRIHLLMANYQQAEFVLKQALSMKDDLLDYNSFEVNLARTFPAEYPEGPGNEEIIYYSALINYIYFGLGQITSELRVNPLLFTRYSEHDLRKQLLFQDKGNDIVMFKGSYYGNLRTSLLFSGLSTDENYLNYAEALVRNDKVGEALFIMNKLLKTRFESGEYVPFESSDKQATLNFILEERWKSLFGRDTRWYDIRRFIKDKEHFIPATKTLDGKDFKFVLGDTRLFIPIPKNEH